MSTTPEMSIYESTFAQSDKTDAILVIEGKKLYVNRAHLSFHSDYFNALFNGEFKEKSMPEIPIEDVKYKEFATLLSLAHPKPIKPKADDYEILLEYADRFMLPGAKLYIELVLIASDIYCVNKIWIGGKYGLDDLIDNGLSAAESEHWSFREIVREKKFKNLPEAAQLKIALKMVVFQ